MTSSERKGIKGNSAAQLRGSELHCGSTGNDDRMVLLKAKKGIRKMPEVDGLEERKLG